jgi:hypothetical protein
LGFFSTLTNSSIAVIGNLVPVRNLTYDLGSTSSQWRSLYVGTSTVYFGGIPLTVSANGTIEVNGNSLTENIRFSNDTIENSAPNGVTLIKSGTVKIVTGNESTGTGFTMPVPGIVGGNVQGNEVSIGVGMRDSVTNVEFPVGSIQPGWEITFKSGTTSSYTATVTAIYYEDLLPNWRILFDGPPVDYMDYDINEGTGGGYPITFTGSSTPLTRNTWTFTAGGGLVFPDATVQTTAYTSLSSDESYTPTTSGDWNGTAPTTLSEAIDRLAALVKSLNSGTGA